MLWSAFIHLLTSRQIVDFLPTLKYKQLSATDPSGADMKPTVGYPARLHQPWLLRPGKRHRSVKCDLPIHSLNC